MEIEAKWKMCKSKADVLWVEGELDEKKVNGEIELEKWRALVSGRYL